MDIRKQGVIRIEPGIIHKNGIYFHSASAFAQQHLFYGLWGAEYICNAPYRVNRKSLNAFLLFFINTGELHFEYRGQKFTAQPLRRTAISYGRIMALSSAACSV